MLKSPPAHETVSKRYLSWEAFWKLRPDLAPKPDNDNEPQTEATVRKAASR
ncbi:hypothetical protein [Mesorhizobium sp.]|uniref:hypothetical protein n=1 Tax=Mesorhizobium sp. TaxID=1871066 RepID=UPI0025EF23AB|nr:hypothetical protein [Mesorhizobium sp.]